VSGGAELITSRRNPLVKRLRVLHSAKGRREAGLLLLEGTHLLQEVVRLGLTPRDLLVTEVWCERHPHLLHALPAGVRPVLVSAEVLEAVATTDHPDGVVLTLEPPAPARDQASFVLALDRLQDPGNLGTLMRTALAAGVEAVWLAEGADPFQPKVLRASSGAALALPLERLEAGSLAERLAEVRRRGLTVAAAVLPGPAWPDPLPYWRHRWQTPTVLLLGNEGVGLDPALGVQVDVALTIPHSPAVDSLNVAVAAAPLLLERWRQGAGGGAAPI